MIPYNNLSYLTCSEKGKFNSYLGYMDMNKSHVASCFEKEYIEDGSQFIAVEVNSSGRETTVFHITLPELNTARSLPQEEQSINCCNLCDSETIEGKKLHKATFGKSATFHDDIEVCKECLKDFQTAFDMEDQSIESQAVLQSI